MSGIFQQGVFQLSSGATAQWRIECDSLSSEDWDTLAALIRRRYGFGGVSGVPRGGLHLAERLTAHRIKCKNYLIVDDVYTTGRSMRAERDRLLSAPGGASWVYYGVVVFARARLSPVDGWISPIFQFWE